MANDEEDAAGNGFADEPYVPSGPRRSTYTPPAGDTPPSQSTPDAAAPASREAYDDDDLANALADQLPRTPSSGDLPIAPGPRLSDLPAPSGPPVVPEAPPAAGPVTGLPPAPRRRSLDDADLVRTLDDKARTPGATLDAIDRLESQMRLREQEAREFREWQDTMLAIGTPEALGSLEAARPAFTGVIDIVPTPFAAEVQEAPAAPSVAEPVPSARRSSFAPPTGPGRTVSVDVSPVDISPVEEPAADEPLERLFAPVVYDLVEPTVPSPFAPPAVGTPVPEDSAPAEPAERDPAGAGVVATPPSPSGFDDLLAGAPSTPPAPFVAPAPTDASLDYDFPPPPPPPTPPTETDPVFIEPVALLDPELGSLQTDSHTIVGPSYEAEPEEDVDDTDRAFDDLLGAFPVTAQGVVTLPPTTGSAPIQPLSSPRVPTDEVVLRDDEPTALPAFAIEAAGQEPTPVDHRVGRAARMFWLWFATNSSVLSVAFGGGLFSLGMSLRQAVVAAFIGVAISFLPLGLGTLAGKWSGQPTMIASRATFGVVGNVVPALLAVVTRMFWGAVLLWLVAISTAHILVGAKLNGPLSELQLTVITMAIGFIIALVVAVFGYSLFSRIQFVLSILSAVLVVGLVLITWPSVHIPTALTVGDGPWILVVTGVVLVFSFIGLVWVNSSSDLARYQRPSSSGPAAMLLAPFGATLPAFLLIAYGALLAASNPEVAHGLVTNPLDTIALMIPIWYPVPLIAATVLSLLSGIVLSIYSGGFALQAVGLRIHRAWSSVIVGVLLFAVAVLLSLTVTSIVPVFRDLATTLAVPVAAWAGIFAAEMIIRRRRFDSASLLRRGGVYPAVNWVNLVMLFVASAVGFGLTTASIDWLNWQGYLFSPLGVKLSSDLAGTDVGVLVALVLGLLTPFVSGVPRIRRQERERVTPS